MDLRNILRIIGGHPVIVVLGLLVTLITGVFLVSRVTPEYEAQASILLRGPSETPTPEGPLDVNPLENPSKVAVMGQAVTDVMRSGQFAGQLVEQGLIGSYEVEVSPVGAGAIVTARTSANSAGATMNDLNLVLEGLDDELENIQSRAEVNSALWIVAQRLAVPDQATPISGSKTRVLAITLALGAVGTYALALLADTLYGDRHFVRDWWTSRHGRRRGEREPDISAGFDPATRLTNEIAERPTAVDDEGGERKAG